MRRAGRIGRGLAVAAAVVLLGTAVAVPPAGASTVAGPVGSATTETVAATTAAGLRVAVSVVDTTTGTTTSAGEAAALFPSESVVKVLVAARLLVEGGLSGDRAATTAAMISASDDAAANRLWGEVGGPDVVAWAADRYGVTGLGAPSEWGWWGNTKVSADGLAALYAALAADPAVGPWLRSAMAATTPVAADGTDQTFGLGRLLATGRGAVKQGWGGDDDARSTANLLSTGYVDDRYAVAVIVQDPAGWDALALTPQVDAVSAAVVDDLTAATEAEDTVAPVDPAAARVDTPDRWSAAAAAPTPGSWWPTVAAVLGAVLVAGATAACLSVATRRRATARPW